MAITYKTTFRLRRGNKEMWQKNNPILEYGEPGYSLDEQILKIGDGLTAWKDLKAINEGHIDEEQAKKIVEEILQEQYSMQLLPKVQPSDAGKILRVNEAGAWEASTLIKAEGVAF